LLERQHKKNNRKWKHYQNLSKSIKSFTKERKEDTHNLPIPTVLINMIPKHKKDFRLIKEAIEGCPGMVTRLENINTGINETHNKLDRIKNIEKKLAHLFLDFDKKLLKEDRN